MTLACETLLCALMHAARSVVHVSPVSQYHNFWKPLPRSYYLVDCSNKTYKTKDAAGGGSYHPRGLSAS